jgi:serine/threonine-protein kinase HipA
MNQVEVWLCDDSLGPDTLIGYLTLSKSRSGDAIRFDYDDSWLANKTPLPPFDLEPSLGAFPGPHHPPADNTLFGIFRDISPDRWGRVLMERREIQRAKSEARPARTLLEWDFLLGVADEGRMGALRLRNPAAREFVADSEFPVPPVTRLRELETIVAELEKPDAEDQPEYRTWLLQLTAPGTSLGGARPKASYVDTDGSMWLAKFPASDDRRDIGNWEYLAARLAARCGIVMPESRIHAFSNRGHTFAVQRFDRAGGSRRLYASAMTLAGRREGEPASYLDIAEVIETRGEHGKIAADLEQLYRRILFSILIGNRDDHLRNHGFLRGQNGWMLSPAFDVNPNPDKAEHTLAIDEADPTPTTATLIASRDYYRLGLARSQEIENEIRSVVASWKAEAARLGIAGREIAALDPVIVPGR